MSMKPMLPTLRLLLPMAGLAVIGFLGAGRRPPEDGKTKSAETVRRGKYLVHRVAMCVVCHTPKSKTGALVESRLLQGAPIPVKNPYAGQPWALKAPKLAGLPGGWSRKSLVEFLQTGKTPHGHDVRPPMPPFRMSKTDAEAVAAYLKSLDAD